MRTITAGFTLALMLASAAPMAWPASASAALASAATVKSEAIIIGANSITYTTRSGDTLSSIARHWTSRAANWVMLGQVNRISRDTNIPIGTAIVIPATLLPDEPSQAKVAALSGSISARTAQGIPIPLALGATISEGMQIDTGSNGFMTLALADASRISLPSNSRIRMSKLRMARYTKSARTEITLLRGRIEARVAPLEKNQGRFEVFTPLGVAGVRGTHFRVGIIGSASVNEVLSGKVEVGQPGKAPALTLQDGQGNIINAKSVGKATPLLAAPRLAQEPILQDAATAQFTVLPIAGARSYHLQLASDNDGQSIFSETRSDKTRFDIGGVPEGSYFARISALDAAGLEGYASTHAVILKTVSNSGKQNAQSPPYVDSSDDKQVSLRWSAEGLADSGKKFKLQVAHDAAFSWLLFTGHTTMPEAKFPRPAFGTYYARVRSINPDGSANPYSNIQAFIVTDQWIINDGKPLTAKPPKLTR